MKERLDAPRVLAPTGELWARVMLAAMLGLVVGGVVLAVAGWVASEPRWLLLGGGVFAAAWAARSWLNQRARLSTHGVVAAAWQEGPEPHPERAAQLFTLLEQWELLEAQRGTADFDPWTLQSLRNEIREVVASDPGLEQLFDRLRQVA